MRLFVFALLFIHGLATAEASANTATQTPADQVVNQVTLEQRIGDELPPDLEFRDSQGRDVRLGDLFDDRPVLLVPVWYSCPNLCGVTLRGLESGLREVDFTVGKDFQVVAISMDPKDSLSKAAGLKAGLISHYDRPGSADGWHLLTGDEESIGQLYQAMGIGYSYDADIKQYAHPATLVLATPAGRISRYLLGVVFEAQTLRLGLLEASKGKLGSVMDKVLLRCYSYDPATGRYSLLVINLIRVAGGTTVALLGGGLLIAIRRERRDKTKGERR